MTHQIIITLTDEEYKALVAAATKEDKQPETFLHDIVQRLELPSQVKRPMTGREFMEKQYREGKLANLPSWEALTQEEEAELERIGKLFVGGKPLSEMIIEDRGPY